MNAKLSVALAVVVLILLTPMAMTYSLGDSIQVCCAWNEELADGDLTYKVSGGDQANQDGMSDAVQLWADAINAQLSADGSPVIFTLTRITDRTKPDIDIKFKNGGGQVQGQAIRSFDNQGFVKSVKINVSGKAFGQENLPEIVAQIVKHEFGHALNIGHADFAGDLMSTTVNAGSLDISDCDVEGVFQANHWKFVDNAAAPHAPHVGSVDCGGGGGPPPPGDITAHVETTSPFTVGRKRELRLAFLIQDDAGNPVGGARVNTQLILPNFTVLGGSATTDENGVATLRLRQRAKDGFYTVVTNVSGDNITFDVCTATDGTPDESTITFSVSGNEVDGGSITVVDDCP